MPEPEPDRRLGRGKMARPGPGNQVVSSVVQEGRNQRNRYERQGRGDVGGETGSRGQLRLKNPWGLLRKNDTKGFRPWKLGNLPISANFGGIHYEPISEAL